ncbi:MAG: hypothetical protein BWY82_01039 [Verrucomicrobia bacterium ADurb.Bin474]|nr:MAG: hypothetical protein BWY82_01039 [Verrucomicrobia bacterium ADurb.Bin474]
MRASEVLRELREPRCRILAFSALGKIPYPTRIVLRERKLGPLIRHGVALQTGLIRDLIPERDSIVVGPNQHSELARCVGMLLQIERHLPIHIRNNPALAEGILPRSIMVR